MDVTLEKFRLHNGQHNSLSHDSQETDLNLSLKKNSLKLYQ